MRNCLCNGKLYLIGIDIRDGDGIGAYIESQSGFALIHINTNGMIKFEHVWSIDAFGPRDRFITIMDHFSPRTGLFPAAIPLERLEGPYILQLVNEHSDGPKVTL